ncbi:WD repeat-containing protein 89 [Ornithorhynchus anatinus]|uniref:WD repeat-containing protein 89 n=1 Tax=Ornithorhynchus anatinus TaxID=9258 RepID=F7G746_ORNAN|nr:WD repeat-containing protein 89 [Ornithorhynchus anatinus]XP_007659408.2 WD repeat-containing protein 89 [Ornithorhynchus anatinus]
MEKMEEQLANLHIAKRSSVTKEPTYLLEIDISRPALNGLVAVSCSNKSIRLYDQQTLHLQREFSVHPGLLSGVKFAHSGDNLLFSACSDGTVKCWDTRLPGEAEARLFKGYPSNVFISFDISCDDRVVCAGTEKVDDDALMVFWDVRGGTKRASPTTPPLGVYSESHNDDITQVCFHPNDPNTIVSGSTDGLVNVFDVGRDNEDDALTATCNSDSSVSFIGWAGKDLRQVYCVTHDEGFYWWDLARLDSDEPITRLSIQDVREVADVKNDHLHYLIGGVYHEKTDRLLVLGGTSAGNVHLMSCCTSGSGLLHTGSLQGGHSATVRSFCWNPEGDSLLTGGEDGQLVLWKPGAAQRSPAKKGALKIGSTVQQRVRVHSQNSYTGKRK